MTQRALVTMFNVAPWGGLQENVWQSCRGMARRGWEITVACSQGPLVDRLTEDHIGVHVIGDWKDWSGDAEDLGSRPWDLVHSHPFASRELALHVAAAQNAPLVSTFHGYNRDYSYRWHTKARSLIAVSRSHADMLVHDSGVPAHKVFVVPNSVPDDVFAVPQRTWHERTRSGTARVLVASRLDPDKHALLEAVDQLTDEIAADHRGLRWVIQLAGSGSSADEIRRFARVQARKSRRISFEALGWVESREIPQLLADATVSIASGRAAQQSLAVGTPTIAFGSRGIYGLQHGPNLQVGLWGNFGGYPLDGVAITSIRTDLAPILDDEQYYNEVASNGRTVASSLLRQSAADETLAGIYQL